MSRLAGPLSWIVLGFVVSLLVVAVLAAGRRRPVPSLGHAVVLVSLGTFLATVLLFVVASSTRLVWLSAGDTSPERIVNIAVWDLPRAPLRLDAHPHLIPSNESHAGFTEVRVYEVDPNPPTVFVGRRDGRWYVFDRENVL